MSKYTNKFKQLFEQFLAFFPAPLPRGMTEFDTWSARLIFAYGLPDNDSIRFALATMIMHLGPTECDKPRRYFGRAVLKGMSAQVANNVMYQLKEKQKAEDAAAKLAEAPAPLQVVSNDQPVSN
jgi:hypothetical protein